jgi:regulator of protease activity HflC (stomatin/prohibitin superfamily)
MLNLPIDKKRDSYLIKNIVKKSFETDFSMNPLNSLMIALFSAAGFILYYLKAPSLELQEMIILIAYPMMVTAMVLIAGKWESLIKLSFIAILGFFWWKGIDTLYCTLPIAIGSFISPMLQITREWERAVVLRHGKFLKLKGPGIFFILPIADSISKKVDLRIRSTDFAAEMTLTRDTVPVMVDAIAFWMIWDGEKAILEVENYLDAVILSAQTALRDSIGKNDLSTLLARREEMGEKIRKDVDKRTSEWGITIQAIEIRDITVPKQLEDVLSKRAQAEREKESRIILGEAEIELANKFHEAARVYNKDETALQLRSMNILFEGLKAGNSMMMVPSSVLESMDLGGSLGVQAINEVRKKTRKTTNKEDK